MMSDPLYRIEVADDESDEEDNTYSYRVAGTTEEKAVETALNSPETADDRYTVTLVECDEDEY